MKTSPFPTAESSFPPDGSSFPRRACPVLDTGREPIPSPVATDDPHTADAAESSFPTAESSSPTAESSSPTAESSSPTASSSFPRRACPVLDTGREPIPGPGPADTDDPHTADAAESSSPTAESSFPRRACPVLDTGREPIPGPVDTDDPHTPDAAGSSFPAVESSFPTAESSFPTVESSFPRRACPVLDTGREPIPAPAEAGDLEDQRGSYDIDRKIAEAQRDPSHPIHKFVQAYDEVAAAFQAEDKQNEDDEVRYWISGEVPDAYGKYIWEYAPAYPRSIRRRLRPKRRRRSTPKAESVWMKRPTDKMREAGIPRPNRFKIWV